MSGSMPYATAAMNDHICRNQPARQPARQPASELSLPARYGRALERGRRQLHRRFAAAGRFKLCHSVAPLESVDVAATTIVIANVTHAIDAAAACRILDIITGVREI